MAKILKTSLTGFLLLCVVLPPTSFPCSSFAFLDGGRLFFGTNYDNEFWPGLMFINPRGLKKSSWEPGTTGARTEWTARYGSLTIACAGYQLPWAGMNEAGLVFATMALSETRVPDADERPAMAGTFWLQYGLDTCATVGDLLATLERIRVSDTVDHYLVADAAGGCAVIEFLGGKPVVRRDDALPVRALTNTVYAQCLAAWKAKAAPSSYPYHSVNRFSRLAAAMDKRREGSPQAAVDDAFAMLADVANSSSTRWSLVFDTGRKIFFIKTFRNSRTRSVDLGRIDFDCDKGVRMLDPHGDVEGDITAAFRPYAHETVMAHMIKALNYFRPGITADFVRQALGMFEKYSCAPRLPPDGGDKRLP